jgi:hypothetical protein
MAIPSNLTPAQLIAMSDALLTAMGNGVRTVRFADGREQEYQSVADMQKARADIYNMYLQVTGQAGDRVALAQHKRGEGPCGPDRYSNGF